MASLNFTAFLSLRKISSDICGVFMFMAEFAG